MSHSTSPYDIVESSIEAFFPNSSSKDTARKAATDYLNGKSSLATFKIIIKNKYGNSENATYFVEVIQGVKVTIKTTNLTEPQHLNRWLKQKYAQHKKMIQRLQVC